MCSVACVHAPPTPMPPVSFPMHTHKHTSSHNTSMLTHSHAAHMDTHLYGNVHTLDFTLTRNPEGLSHQTRDYLSKSYNVGPFSAVFE